MVNEDAVWRHEIEYRLITEELRRRARGADGSFLGVFGESIGLQFIDKQVECRYFTSCNVFLKREIF